LFTQYIKHYCRKKSSEKFHQAIQKKNREKNDNTQEKIPVNLMVLLVFHRNFKMVNCYEGNYYQTLFIDGWANRNNGPF